MIVRTWTGRVPEARAAAFAVHLLATGLTDYRRQPGCREVRLSRSDQNGWSRFTLVSIWTDMDAIRAYAGDTPERAVLYPGDERFELDPDLEVRHERLIHAKPELRP